MKLDANSLHIYYAVTFELATMYVDVSKEHIMPGLDMLSGLSLRDHDPNEVDCKIRLIARYTKEVQIAINEAAQKVRTPFTTNNIYVLLSMYHISETFSRMNTLTLQLYVIRRSASSMKYL
jgi:hypothetical protein